MADPSNIKEPEPCALYATSTDSALNCVRVINITDNSTAADGAEIFINTIGKNNGDDFIKVSEVSINKNDTVVEGIKASNVS